MTESGTATYTDPADYQLHIGGARANLVLTECGDFRAHLTWLKLRHLQLFRGCESAPRIAHLSLVPARIFVSYSIESGAGLVWNGIELQACDVVFHSRGESSHHRTKGASLWGLISITPARLTACSQALTGAALSAPSFSRVLRPSQSAAAQLKRLHLKACHLVKTKPEIIARQEAAHSLEQDLIHALVNCLMAEEACGNLATMRNHAEIMNRFEDVSSAPQSWRRSTTDICGAVDVPERTLRLCCTEFLGVSPVKYIRLRRLNLVRSALWRADPATTTVAEIAQQYRFSELGRFAVAYRSLFGETPSATLRRTTIKFR